MSRAHVDGQGVASAATAMPRSASPEGTAAPHEHAQRALAALSLAESSSSSSGSSAAAAAAANVRPSAARSLSSSGTASGAALAQESADAVPAVSSGAGRAPRRTQTMGQPSAALVDEPEEDESWPDEAALAPNSRGPGAARATTMLTGWADDGGDDDAARTRAAEAAAHGLLTATGSQGVHVGATEQLPASSAVPNSGAARTTLAGRNPRKPLRSTTLDPAQHLRTQQSADSASLAEAASSSDDTPLEDSTPHVSVAPQAQRPDLLQTASFLAASSGPGSAMSANGSGSSPESSVYATYPHSQMDLAAFESYRTTPDPYAPMAPPTPQHVPQQARLHFTPGADSAGQHFPRQQEQMLMYTYQPGAPQGQPPLSSPYTYAQPLQPLHYAPPPPQALMGQMGLNPNMGAWYPAQVAGPSHVYHPPPSPLVSQMPMEDGNRQQQMRDGAIGPYGAGDRRPYSVAASPRVGQMPLRGGNTGAPGRSSGGHRRVPTGPGGMMLPTGGVPYPAGMPVPQGAPLGIGFPGGPEGSLPFLPYGPPGSMHSRTPSSASYHSHSSMSHPQQYRAPSSGNGFYQSGRHSSSPSVAGSRSGSASGAATPARSPLLEEFRSKASKGRRFELKDIRGAVVEFSGDQHGSRFTQERLDVATREERDAVFDELLPAARTLMSDVFGNYVIQKLLEYGTVAQRSTLIKEMSGHVLELSLGTYGCRVVQKALDHALPEEQLALADELREHVLQCVKDQNANHVVQKILERIPDAAHIDFVPAAFRGHVPQLAAHCYSCRVLQRIFEHCAESQARPLMLELQQHTLQLMQDQYGNYVIQWTLQRGAPADRNAVIDAAKGQLLTLSRHKFASNVVEEIFRTASPAQRRELIEEMLAVPDVHTAPAPIHTVAPMPAAVLMMRDQFANYVVQRALETAEPEQRARLGAAVRPHLASMRRYAKHLAAIEKLLGPDETAVQSRPARPTASGSATVTPPAAVSSASGQSTAAPSTQAPAPAPTVAT